MKFGFIAKHRSVWPAAWLCRSAWRIEVWLPCLAETGGLARALREDEAIMPAVRASFVASARTYGARRICCAMCWKQAFRAACTRNRTSDARSGAAGAATQARPAKGRWRTFSLNNLAECARPPIHGGPAQPQMDCRFHVCLDGRGAGSTSPR